MAMAGLLPNPGAERSRASELSLPADCQTLVAAFLDLRSLLKTVEAWRLGLGDDAFRGWIPVASLFRLKAPPAPPSWRARCRAELTARRRDVAVVPGRFRFEGTSEDRKGVVETRGTMTFADAYAIIGDVVHVRGGADPSVLAGTGRGHLCAAIAAGAGKRRWALAWKEHVERSVGNYAYFGQLLPRADGTLTWAGTFTWIGLCMGTFSYRLTREGD